MIFDAEQILNVRLFRFDKNRNPFHSLSIIYFFDPDIDITGYKIGNAIEGNPPVNIGNLFRHNVPTILLSRLASRGRRTLTSSYLTSQVWQNYNPLRASPIVILIKISLLRIRGSHKPSNIFSFSRLLYRKEFDSANLRLSSVPYDVHSLVPEKNGVARYQWQTFNPTGLQKGSWFAWL